MTKRSSRLDILTEAWQPEMRQAFLDSIYEQRANADYPQIVRMLENGDVAGAMRAVNLDPVSFRPFEKALGDTFEAGGVATADAVPVGRDANGFKVAFNFNLRNPAAEAWLNTYSSTLVQDVVTDQRDMIRGALSAGQAAGDNPRTTALDLVGRIDGLTGRREGGLIGLTASQEQWIRNYRAELTSASPTTALSRDLRDARFDATVAKAASEGTSIPAAKIDAMVTAYKNRALAYRAEAIARSETMTALHQAQDLAMQQAIGRGVVDFNQVEYIWRATRDGRTRDAHRALDGQVAKAGVPFQSSLGPIRFPGDPQASAANRINCRCWRESKINFLAGLK